MRKYLIALLALTSLAFVSACGTSGGDSEGAKSDTPETTEAPAEETTTTEAASDTVAVDEWAADFCGNFSAWLDEIQTASGNVASEVTPGDIESAQTAIANLFQSASDATQTLITSLEEGGAPDIEDGDQLVDDLQERFQGFDDAAQTAKGETEALATEDITTFQTEADALNQRFQDEVDKVGDSFDEIDANYPSAELNAALTESCNF